ncbi:MAG: helix-turn-helix domain-containing protein [Roseomonas sp.]|nr:helix-turn-helix domain-containing protein [Roseomonas sp.]
MQQEVKTRPRRQPAFRSGAADQSDEFAARQCLAARVAEALQLSGMTQLAAANLLQIDQPKVSRLMRAHFEDFSTQRLMKFLTLLGQDVEIVVHPLAHPLGRGAGRIRVTIGGAY